MTSHRYAAVSFDVGYTLIEPIYEAPALLALLLEQQGVVPEAEALRFAFERAERLFLEDYLRPLGDTWEADARIFAFYDRYYAQVLADLGVPDDGGVQGRLIIQRYLAPDNWRVYPQVIETLAALRARDYRLGIASDWGSGLPRILHALGLSRYLDWAVVSGMIGAAKPSPRFYGLVVQRAAVPVDQIVHVGDSYYGDIRGARTVGMDGVLIDWRRRPLPPLDVPVIHALSELPALIEG